MTPNKAARRALLAAILCLRAATAVAQSDPSWTQAFEPFKIADNLYFVGTRGLSSYLLTTPQGHVLIDTGVEATVPMIIANIEKLGFKPTDIKILLSSHAHFDHVGGHADMQRLTGATVMAIGDDAAALAAGTDNSALGGPGWKPVKIGRLLLDGDTVALGGTTLTAHLTPGHTKGCTTWTTTVMSGGRRLSVVFVGGTSVNAGVRLLANARHPGIVGDYERTFRVLKELKAEIFLAQHPAMFDMEAKVARLKPGAPNPFVDAKGYEVFVAQNEKAYQARLAAERGK